jgi:catechol 2,3-dioxygenase-like lactoylglutathione lyase family enzyme
LLRESRVIAFIATTDATRSRAFYEGVLDLQFVADDPDALVFEAQGIMLRISKVQSFNPAPFTVLGWEVVSLVSTVQDLVSKGVVFERFAGFTQDELGIFVFPDGTQVAWFKDPDDNLLSLTQFP